MCLSQILFHSLHLTITCLFLFSHCSSMHQCLSHLSPCNCFISKEICTWISLAYLEITFTCYWRSHCPLLKLLILLRGLLCLFLISTGSSISKRLLIRAKHKMWLSQFSAILLLQLQVFHCFICIMLFECIFWDWLILHAILSVNEILLSLLLFPLQLLRLIYCLGLLCNEG